MDAEYSRWLERNATTTVLVYSGIIAFFLPLFHFILIELPGVVPGSDSLALRCWPAALSLGVAALLAYKPMRRYAVRLQLISIATTAATVAVLVVNSGNHYAYVASGMLVVIGAQQAFYRPSDLALTFSAGFLTEAAYSALHGIFWTPNNLGALGTFGAAYVIGFIPAVLRMRIQEREIRTRIEAQRVKDELHRLARFDTLTTLPNRVAIQDILADEIHRAARSGTSCAVAFVDLDRFKDVNDTLGHDVGDHLLQSVSGRLANVLGAEGVLARWGGDEFVVVLANAQCDDSVAELAARLVQATAEPFFIDDLELTVTASVGIAKFPRDGCGAGILIRNADTAMYKAKQDLGRGYAFFSDAMHAAATSRHTIRHALRKALTDDDLILHFQPIVDAQTNRIVAAEALVRWNGPDGRLRMPAEFMSVAEDSRIIVPLGTWVLNAACRQAVCWHDAGLDMTVALNVSPRQFAHPDFVETVAQALRSTGADPASIEIEITEAAIMSNVEPVIATLKAVHAMGIRVAIDDFGTGYSSFAYLKRFEVSSLKIDRTFVDGIENEDNLAIAAGIVSVAHALRLPVTAEGVETAAQAEYLGYLGCDRLQGYYFGRPMPIDDFEAALRRAALPSAATA